MISVARHWKLIFFESGARHDKRDMLMRWDKREISAGELQGKILRQLLDVMVSRHGRRKVSS